ncbi:unnamed protein product [Cuscuta epithymum]|uniref:Uncharacterized protein n=1 Tax=Cuscuta epithymum TaxID=186058 RepID=A0AAV0FTT8_9ASTE|nr:unnamed protein product [Cuscuta epithymum]
MANVKPKNFIVSRSNSRLHNINSNGVKSKSRIALSVKKGSEPVNHWDFLDEIEAPMWVDLAVESKSAYTDVGDDWFNTSHVFHQSSAREMIAAFSCIGEVRTGMQQQSSPKLPPSVSRSRGKDYRNREWVQGNQKLTMGNKHPIVSLNSNSSSTSDILLALRMKRCATRPAVRVMGNSHTDSAQKSSSSKSSVGSSYPQMEDGNISQTKDITPESRHVFRVSKVHYHARATQRKALLPKRGSIVVVPNVVSKANESKGSTFKRTVARGKENAPWAMSMSQNKSSRERTGAIIRVQAPKVLKERVIGTNARSTLTAVRGQAPKVSKERVPGAIARTTLTGSKVALESRREVKNLPIIGRKVFLR